MADAKHTVTEARKEIAPIDNTPKNFQPPGLIPPFNDWGNHPDDMRGFLESELPNAYNRMGIPDKATQALDLILKVLQELAHRSDQFSGRHTPSPAMEALLNRCLDDFIDDEQLEVIGLENFLAAQELVENGADVIIAPNHTSPLDGSLLFKAIRDTYPNIPLPAIVMSQVFEYARITALLTSGLYKFPVFQPKHLQKFEELGYQEAVSQMVQQNLTMLRCLIRFLQTEDKQLFLYLERDRNNHTMGQPEPKVIELLEMIAESRRLQEKPLYILPVHISGLESIFPNREGVNELDIFWETISVGGGRVQCGKPVLYEELRQEAINPEYMRSVAERIGGNLTQEQKTHFAIAFTILRRIAALAPSEEAKGIYSDIETA
jgi:1-acyl-sn-glycerol-3-phosphate acyltransferase